MFNREPEMGKNFWLALALSMLVIFGYPLLLGRLRPKPSPLPSLPAQEMIDRSLAEQPTEVSVESNPQIEALREEPEQPKTFHMETDFYSLDFSTLGGTITRLWYKGENEQGNHTQALFYEGTAAQPGIFGVRLLRDDEDWSQKVFYAPDADADTQQQKFIYEKKGEYRVTKTFSIKPSELV